jgi:hypothetical protein
LNPMRSRLCSALISVALGIFVLPARAQDPQKIVEQYFKAAGGSKALSRVHTLTIEGTFTNCDGKSGTYTWNTKFPNRYYAELVSGDVTLIEAYNGKSAWHQLANGELATLTGAEGSQLEAAGLYYNTRLVDAKKNKVGIGFAENVKIHGRDAQEIEATTASGVKWRISFDAQTHLVARELATVGGVEEELVYDDYRTVSGAKLPFKIELRRGGKDPYHITVTRAVVNGTIGERVFDFPKKSQVQLPDLKALFKEIEANQKAIDKIKENYAGTRSEEETEYDKTGKISKRQQREYAFFYLDGDEVSTLVKKEGKPLSEDEQKKENEKTQKEIERIQKREAKKEAKEEKAKEQGKEEKNDDEVGIDTFLRACQFVNPRRERFRGQDVLVFDFEPNPEFKPRKLAEKVVHELAGVVWIDEKARDVARLEAYFVGDFRFGGGVLANLQKGTSFAFEQAYVNNEVWLPTYAEAHLGARVLLVKSIKINEVTRYSDYRRFNVESIATIGKPKEGANSAAPASDPPPATPPKPE